MRYKIEIDAREFRFGPTEVFRKYTIRRKCTFSVLSFRSIELSNTFTRNLQIYFSIVNLQKHICSTLLRHSFPEYKYVSLEDPDIRTAGQVSTHFLRGGLFENLVINEFVKASYNIGEEPNLTFWRDSTGNEVDLLQ